MNQLFETLFSQYSAYSTLDVFLELTAVFFGVVSVLYAKKKQFTCLSKRNYRLHNIRLLTN